MRTYDTATWSDWAVDRALRGIIGTALALPYARRIRWFGAAIERGVGPLSGYRKRAERQVAMIWPDMAEGDVKRIARACCNNFGRTMIEGYSKEEYTRHLSGVTPTGAGLEALAQAKAEGRPVLFVTGHFGNHDAPRHVLNRLGYTIGGIYKPISNPYFNDHYVSTINTVSGPVFPIDRDGMAGFMRMLRDGGMGTMLFDVRVKKYPAIPFLGVPAHTSTGLGSIALKTGALIVPYFGTRQPDGLSFDVAVEAPVDLTTPDQIMRDVTDRLEARIEAQPEQYFWVHRRWD
ncbi:lysophospholipid acyltransferase family protein [Pseudooctadecabacter jejudonensis]|nr:lauroyl acyltransferase [Pseudooctadecabacter jejudonensis]